MATLDAVCFDLDNTLCLRDDHEFHEAIFDVVDVEPFFGPTAINDVDTASLPPADSVTEFWENIFRAVVTDAGGDPDHATALADATMTVLTTRPPVTFTDGAREALEYARERFDVGLITQGKRELQSAKIEALGLDDYVDTTVFCGPSTDTEGKPDPEPFERALAELDAEPEHAIYVGDSLEADVAGAHEAELRSVWVPPAGIDVDSSSRPTHSIESLADLPDVL